MNLLRSIILSCLCASLHGLDDVIISCASGVVLTLRDFKNKLEKLKRDMPEVEHILNIACSDDQLALYGRMVDAHVNIALSKKYVQTEGLSRTREFQEEHSLFCKEENSEELEIALYLRTLEDALLKEYKAACSPMSDEDLRIYYEQNRDENTLFWQEPFLSEAFNYEEPEKADKFVLFETVGVEVRQLVEQIEFNEFCENRLEELKRKYQFVVDKTCLEDLVNHTSGDDDKEVLGDIDMLP